MRFTISSRTALVLAFLVGVPLVTLIRLAADRAPEQLAAAPEAAPPAKQPPSLFRGWNRAPDVALVLSGQQHGYINPCGCSRPQYGGLPRRANLIQGLKDRGWPVVGIDLGDLIEPPGQRGPQSLLKYATSMKALDRMGYIAVGLGQHEIEMPLLETLGRYAVNAPSPRVVAANLQQRQANYAGAFAAWEVSKLPNVPRVAVIGLIGPSVQRRLPTQSPALGFDATSDALQAAVKELQTQKPEVYVLVYQGSVAEARACAKACKQLHVILCLADDPEAEERPDRVHDTLIVRVGHKGQSVGVVGVYRGGNAEQPIILKYQLVDLGPGYETKPGKEKDNPVLALLEAYTQEVKDGDYLERYLQRPHPLQVDFPQAAYVGSAACLDCHPAAAKVWSNHPHGRAFDTLKTASRPARRQFDGECVVCHTTGFGYTTGYENETKTALLKHVGCESCHGPGSLHADLGKKTPAKMLALMNPYKPRPNESAEEEKRRLLKLDMDCQRCHDVDNDVGWTFAKKWPAVIHRTPKKD